MTDICPICNSLQYGCCPSVALGDPWLCRKPQPRDIGEELTDIVKVLERVKGGGSHGE